MVTEDDRLEVVHGAQRVTLNKPLAPEGTLSTVARVKGLYDLRKFTIAHVETETSDASGERVFDTPPNVLDRWRKLSTVPR